MLIKFLKPDFVFNDERGNLTQIMSSGCGQVNSVFTKAGAVRGNLHYHSESNEMFFVVSGRLAVEARLGDETEYAAAAAGDLFLIEKGIRHKMDYLEDTYLVVMYDKPVEKADGTKDILTD